MRPRRGSLERPLNGRLYRGTFLLLSLPLLVLAFSVGRVGPLPAPQLPPSFDGQGARQLAVELASRFPDRVPGTVGAQQAARWFRSQISPYGLPVASDTWTQSVAGLGNVRLQNMWAVAAGQSSDAIVVMAHRDDSGGGPGANDNASGTATLVELARSYAQPDTLTGQRVRTEHTLVFLSTDGGAFGAVGAARFVKKLPFHVVAAIDLDAIAGPQTARLVITGDAPRSPAAVLVQTAAQRVLEQTHTGVRRAGFFSQLVDLGFPFTLYEQGPLVAHGIPAVTLTTAGDRAPPPFSDRPGLLDQTRLTTVGRAAQELLGSLDQGLELAQGTTSYVWAGSRIVRGWAIELLYTTLLLPFFVVVVDLFAHCRRRGIRLVPAVKTLRSRVYVWLFAGVTFYVFRLLGAWPTGAPHPPDPSLPATGHWAAWSLGGFAIVLLLAWIVGRHRLVPRRAVTDEERLAGETAALLGLAIVALLVLATAPFALLFVLPAMHFWLWLPQVRRGALPARWVFLIAGLAGPLIVPLSLALRFHLGFDAPWYLLELVSVGYVGVVPVAIALVGGACVAQLVAVSAGRYAPYPARHERPERGPIRELVRTLVLANRRRGVTRDDGRAFGP
ncbi:MAG TPA: M28 family peptidase [Gaiellaceae bacterium]